MLNKPGKIFTENVLDDPKSYDKSPLTIGYN